MTDDLRTRIIEVQLSHIPIDYAGGIECACGTECQPQHGGIDVAEQMWADHVADAVIEALNLDVATTYLSADKLRREVCVEGYYTVEAADV